MSMSGESQTFLAVRCSIGAVCGGTKAPGAEGNAPANDWFPPDWLGGAARGSGPKRSSIGARSGGKALIGEGADKSIGVNSIVSLIAAASVFQRFPRA